LEKEHPQLEEEPFNSTRKYMISLNKFDEEKNVVMYKGAPERILEMSKYTVENGTEIEITDTIREKLLNLHREYSEKGLRLLGVGYKKIDKKYTALKEIKDIDKDTVFAGYFIIKDPIRSGVKETIKTAAKAGIRTVMITGDHRNTAKNIAKELGLKVTDHSVVDGEELAKMSEYDFRSIIEKINVFARVSPVDKIRIVDALQEKGRVVAMTGDGINDAPALKAADIGIAVGAGTDVTKGVADIVLLDNNFKTIIAAIKEGRIIVDNIKKVIVYLLSDSFSEMILIIGSLLLGLPLPITAAQILWINLITDGFPYIALTVEKGEKDVMKLKPRSKKEPILDREMKILIFVIGIFTDIVLLLLFKYYLGITNDLFHARTVVFAALGLDSLLYVFSVRSLRAPIWRTNPFSNKYLIAAVIGGLGLQFIALYHPFFIRIFKLTPLTLNDWILIVSLGLLQIIGIEIVKKIFISKGIFRKVKG